MEQPQEFIAKEEIDLIKVGKKNVVWAKATFKHLIQKLAFSFVKKVLLSQEAYTSGIIIIGYDFIRITRLKEYLY